MKITARPACLAAERPRVQQLL